MSRLAQSFYEATGLLGLPVFSLVLFVTLFVVITVRAMRTRKSELDALAHIPLEDGRE